MAFQHLRPDHDDKEKQQQHPHYAAGREHGAHAPHLRRQPRNQRAQWANTLTDEAVTVVPPKARELLARFDARSQHYEVRTEHLVG